MVFVDSGSFLAEKKQHNYTQFLRNYLDYTVGNLGVKEFQIIPTGSQNFKRYIDSLTRKSQFPLIASNIFDLKSANQIKWEGVVQSSIQEVNQVKIGFVGIITPNAAEKIPDRQINGLYFQNAAKKIMAQTKKLKRKGAQVIVLMGNGELDCTSQLSHQEKIVEDKVNFSPFESYHCDIQRNVFYKVLKQLPPLTVDIVFSNGALSKVANYINDYPVLQNKGHGQYLSWAELVFDRKHNTIDKKQTKIFQPIQLCHQFLKDSQDCYTKESIEDNELVPAKFLGQVIRVEDIPRFK